VRLTFWLFAFGLPFTLTRSAVAQAILRPGDRVRFTTTAEPGRQVEGIVMATGDTLKVESTDPTRTMASGAPARRTIAITRNALASIEVRRVGRSNALKGAATGGGIGTALGLMIGALASTEGNGGLYSVSSSDILHTGLALGGVVAVVGRLICAASHSNIWEPVTIASARARVWLGSVGNAVVVGGNVRF
jgi:hypothetical protein